MGSIHTARDWIMSNVFIFGDSFSADIRGWPKYLSSKTGGTRGSSEYRILKNYINNKDKISSDDYVIICHTHWSRVYLKDSNRNLLSRALDTHPWCDILFSDVHAKKEEEFVKVLHEIWDEEYFKYIYDSIINDLFKIPNSIHITFFDDVAEMYSNKIVSFADIKRTHAGKINHMNNEGNDIVSKKLGKIIDESR